MTMIFALIAAVLVFVVVLRLLDAASVGGRAVATARMAAGTLRSGAPDAEKEVAARRAAIGLFRSFVALTLIAVAAFAASGAVVWAGSAAGLYPLDGMMATATDWPFLLASTLVGVAAWVATERAT